MRERTCQCSSCRAGRRVQYEEEATRRVGMGDSPFSEAEETELAMELLTVSSEEELDQFLGKLLKGVGSAVGKIARPLTGALKGVAKKVLPLAGGALGSFIPIPGVGTAVGSALGTAVSKALEAELTGLELEEQEFEMARRFVRIAGTAAQQAAHSATSLDPEATVRSAVMRAARHHLPTLGGAIEGRWMRRGNQIVILGA
jgi:hypothetical protein